MLLGDAPMSFVVGISVAEDTNLVTLNDSGSLVVPSGITS